MLRQRRPLDRAELGQRVLADRQPGVAEHGQERELEALEVDPLRAEHRPQRQPDVLARSGIDRVQAPHAGEHLADPHARALRPHRRRQLSEPLDNRVPEHHRSLR